MNRRKYLEGLGAVVATGAVAGCAGAGVDDGNGDSGGEDEHGLLSTSITDQPNDIGDFESLVVTIEGIWVKPDDADDGDASEEEEDADGDTDADGEEDEDADVDQGSGRRYIEFEEPQEADLVGLQGDETQLIDETELETGEYGFLQLDVSETTGTLEDGDEAVVETPGNAPLQFQQAFEIRAEERTRFIADFAPFRRGTGEYLIRPVASGTRVLYGDEEYDGGDDETEDGDEEADGGGSENAGGNSVSAAGY